MAKASNLPLILEQLHKLELYGCCYQKQLCSPNDNPKLRRLRRELKNIPDELITLVEHFARMDHEYPMHINHKALPTLTYLRYSRRLRAPWELITDHHWLGYWQKASGADMKRFLTYLLLGLCSKEYQLRRLPDVFCEEWGWSPAPYCIHAAEYVRSKYFHKNPVS